MLRRRTTWWQLFKVDMWRHQHQHSPTEDKHSPSEDEHSLVDLTMVQRWHSLDICPWLNISICLRDKPKCRQHLFDWWSIYSPIFIPRNTSHCCNSYCDLINENWMNYSHWYLKGKIWTPILSLVFWACSPSIRKFNFNANCSLIFLGGTIGPW